jgi:hypothetical protein
LHSRPLSQPISAQEWSEKQPERVTAAAAATSKATGKMASADSERASRLEKCGLTSIIALAEYLMALREYRRDYVEE